MVVIYKNGGGQFVPKQDSKALSSRPLANSPKTFNSFNAPKTLNVHDTPKKLNDNQALRTLNVYNLMLISVLLKF